MHTEQRQTQNPHKQWEVHNTINQQQQNRRTDSSLSYRGGGGGGWGGGGGASMQKESYENYHLTGHFQSFFLISPEETVKLVR